MKEEDCYSARQKPSGGPFNLSSLAVSQKKEKEKKKWINIRLWPQPLGKRGKDLCNKNAYFSQWIWMGEKQWTRNSMCCISKKRGVKISASERGRKLVHTAAHLPPSSVTYSLHWGRWSLFQVQHLYHVVSNKKKKIEKKKLWFWASFEAKVSRVLGQWWQEDRWLPHERDGLFLTGNSLKICARVALNLFQSLLHWKMLFLSLLQEITTISVIIHGTLLQNPDIIKLIFIPILIKAIFCPTNSLKRFIHNHRSFATMKLIYGVCSE